MKLIDSHCHLDVADFDADRQQVLTHARQIGVKGFVVPGVIRRDWSRIKALAEQEEDVYPAYGLHPMFVASHREEDLDALDDWLKLQGVIAVGEIGLDFYNASPASELQHHFFASQLSLAAKHDLPVILHVRKAHDAVLQHLRHSRVKGGTAHAFNGSIQQARQYLDLGFKLGFGGMLTYQRSTRLRELATALPLEAIVLETDAPDMTVASHRGERNSPEYLPECLAALAEVRNEPVELIAEVTTRNALTLFNLPAH